MTLTACSDGVKAWNATCAAPAHRGLFGLRLGCAGQLERGAEQHVCSVDAVRPRRVLARVVADAAGRGDEDHPARDDRGESLSVVAGTGWKLHRRQAERCGCASERALEARIEL